MSQERKKHGWHELRFVEDENKVRVDCKNCARPFWLPKSKAHKYRCCSSECSSRLVEIKMANRQRACEKCGEMFVPRKTQIDAGIGKFCSQKCNPSWKTMHSKQAREAARASFISAIKSGKYLPPSRESHPNWNGGPEAARQRRLNSDELRAIAAARTRTYRKNNPEKAREYASSRSRRKYGRLPNGTVSKLMRSQKEKCVVCKKSLLDGYHVDHIVPLKLGGLHEPKNIQLLCPSCNVRKSAKDPVKFMQENGYLL